MKSKLWNFAGAGVLLGATAAIVQHAWETGDWGLAAAAFFLGAAVAGAYDQHVTRRALERERLEVANLKKDQAWLQRRAQPAVAVLDLVIAGKWGEAEAHALRWVEQERTPVRERKAG